MKCLIVLELVPEITKIAVVELTQLELSEIIAAHNVTINSDDCTEAQYLAHDKISAAFCDNIEYCEDEAKGWFGKFKEFYGNDISDCDIFIRTTFLL